MKYQSVAILGAGAVGSYVMWGLAKKKEIDLCVVASGERKARYERDGFVINGQVYHPAVRTPEEAAGVDLLIVATKYQALRSALGDIQTVVSEHTTVMSLMNGVDSEEIIGEIIDPSKIVHSLIKVASERKGNQVVFDPETTIGIIYGEADLSRGTGRIEALNDLFADTGLHYRATDVILTEIWSKFRLNVPNNQAQAMVGCGVGAYRDSEHVAFCGTGCGKRWTGSRRKRGSILTRRIPRPLSAVRCGIGRAIPRCRIWMRGATRKWTCSPARWCAWGVNWEFRHRTMSLPTI